MKLLNDGMNEALGDDALGDDSDDDKWKPIKTRFLNKKRIAIDDSDAIALNLMDADDADKKQPARSSPSPKPDEEEIPTMKVSSSAWVMKLRWKMMTKEVQVVTGVQ